LSRVIRGEAGKGFERVVGMEDMWYLRGGASDVAVGLCGLGVGEVGLSRAPMRAERPRGRECSLKT
jgi:hypothetical protein